MAIAVAQKKKKKKEELEVDTEFWMVTFGDLLSLLLTFFVLLFSMASLDDKSLKEMFSTFSGGAGALFYSDTFPTAQPIPEIRFAGRSLKVNAFLEFLKNQMRKTHGAKADTTSIVKAFLLNDVHITKRGPVFVLSFQDRGMFASGSADLLPSIKPALKNLGDILRYSSTRLIIEGHTDDTPISSARYPSNWELSSARASAVMRYFVENKYVESKRMSIAGYADTKPVVKNLNDVFRARNRRVDILMVQAPEA